VTPETPTFTGIRKVEARQAIPPYVTPLCYIYQRLVECLIRLLPYKLYELKQNGHYYAHPLSFYVMFHKTGRCNTMNTKALLDEAMKLKPEERFTLVEGLIQSLDEPDKRLDEIWAEESEKRLKAYREGRLEGISMEEIFKEE